MACELADCSIVAVDISEGALGVARKNAADLGVGDKIDFGQSDMFEAVDEGAQFDLILSNPPYIAETAYDDLPPEVLADPKVAMTSGGEA